MRPVLEALVLCSILVIGGCGGSGDTSTPLPAAQHGGNIMPLPGGKGFAELLVERKTSGGKSPSKTRLVAYFYQPDGSTALTPAPSDVKVRLGMADKGTDVTLTSQTSPAGIFASEPGEFPDELRGQIELKYGGEPLKTTFTFR
jgi:hypothetical protein